MRGLLPFEEGKKENAKNKMLEALWQ